jgi:hypothetical protein
MKNLNRSFLGVAATVFFILTIAAAQQQTPPARLTISLPQKQYQVGDSVEVTYRITNTSDSLLCLPPPSFNCYSISGGFGTTAIPPRGVTLPKNGGCAADRFGDKEAGYDIDHHWIKLAPAQTYEITQQSRLIQLIAPGKWTIDAGYYPAREDTLSLYQDAMKARRCNVVPQLHAGQVVITATGELK